MGRTSLIPGLKISSVEVPGNLIWGKEERQRLRQILEDHPGVFERHRTVLCWCNSFKHDIHVFLEANLHHELFGRIVEVKTEKSSHGMRLSLRHYGTIMPSIGKFCSLDKETKKKNRLLLQFWTAQLCQCQKPVPLVYDRVEVFKFGQNRWLEQPKSCLSDLTTFVKKCACPQTVVFVRTTPVWVEENVFWTLQCNCNLAKGNE